MTTRLILATQPWSTVAITPVVICAMPTATASPLVVISTTSSSTSMPDSNLGLGAAGGAGRAGEG